MSVQLRDDQNRPSAGGVKSLPDGWLIKPLGEVVTRIIGGGTPSRENPDFWKGNIPWLTVKDMRTTRPADAIDHISKNAVAESSTSIIPADTVIIATRVGLGKVIRVPYEAAINQDLKALIVPSTIEKSFLEFWFLSIASYLESIGSGTTVKGIRLEQLKAIEMPVPSPKEQRRIVAEIEKQFTRLEAGVAALRRVQANLKRYRAAVLKAACEGRLVPTEAELTTKNTKSTKTKPASLSASSAISAVKNSGYETGAQLLARILTERRQNWQGRGQYKEPAAPDTANLGPLPEGWTQATVEQLTSLVATGATPLRGKSDFWNAGNIPWVTSGALNDDFVTEAFEFITPLAIQKTNAKLFPAGTLLVALYGEGKTRGKVSELKIEAATNQACAALLFSSANSAMRPYLKVFLQNNYEAVRLLASGGVQPNLSLSIMKNTIVPLPPLAEQTRIVAEVERRLSVVEELESVVSTNLQRATRLRQSILQKAFTGELA